MTNHQGHKPSDRDRASREETETNTQTHYYRYCLMSEYQTERFKVPEIGPRKVIGMKSSTEFITNQRIFSQKIFPSKQPHTMDVRQHEPRRDTNQREGLRASWSEPKIIPRIGVQGSFSPSRSSRYNRGSVSFQPSPKTRSWLGSSCSTRRSLIDSAS